MSHLIRRAAPVVLAAAVLGMTTALPAGAAQSSGKGAVAAAGKCKKKKAKSGASAAAKKKKKCKRGSPGGGNDPGLPGQPTPPTPQPVGGTGPGGGGPGGGSEEREVLDITVTDNPVLGGEETQGEVTIDDDAPEGGQPVELSADIPARADVVPDSVHVAEGETSANFTVETTAGPTVVATIIASIGASSRQVALNIVEEPSVDRVELEYQCFPGLGSFAANRVFLDVPTPSDTAVNLTSSNTGALNFPGGSTDTVTVPEGSTSTLFGVNTLATTPSVAVMGNIAGTVPNPSDSARIRDGGSAAPQLAAVSVTPSTIPPDADNSIGTVTLDCEAEAGGMVVELESSSPFVTVPSTVTVAQDSLTATFPITTTANASGEVTISADTVETDLKQAILTIEDIGT